MIIYTEYLKTTSFSALYSITGTLEPSLSLLNQKSSRSYMRLLSNGHTDEWLEISHRIDRSTSDHSRILKQETRRINQQLNAREVDLPIETLVLVVTHLGNMLMTLKFTRPFLNA